VTPVLTLWAAPNRDVSLYDLVEGVCLKNGKDSDTGRSKGWFWSILFWVPHGGVWKIIGL
jgi:hypothetical protein